MADSTPDSGGSIASFTNTPQAKDDTYTYLEDLLRNNSTLYNVVTNTITLDVMANDLGGNAKTLFSVEDGDGNALTADYTLLAKDVGSNGCSAWEETFCHNWVRINNGKIEYRIADGTGIPGSGRSVDSLTDGQNFNDQFVYAIRLGNGTLSEATVKIHITGAQTPRPSPPPPSATPASPKPAESRTPFPATRAPAAPSWSRIPISAKITSRRPRRWKAPTAPSPLTPTAAFGLTISTTTARPRSRSRRARWSPTR